MCRKGQRQSPAASHAHQREIQHAGAVSHRQARALRKTKCGSTEPTAPTAPMLAGVALKLVQGRPTAFGQRPLPLPVHGRGVQLAGGVNHHVGRCQTRTLRELGAGQLGNWWRCWAGRRPWKQGQRPVLIAAAVYVHKCDYQQTSAVTQNQAPTLCSPKQVNRTNTASHLPQVFTRLIKC